MLAYVSLELHQEKNPVSFLMNLWMLPPDIIEAWMGAQNRLETN